MTMGNTHPHAVAIRPASYGHGTILGSAADEARKSTQGRRMIRARVMALGNGDTNGAGVTAKAKAGIV